MSFVGVPRAFQCAVKRSHKIVRETQRNPKLHLLRDALHREGQNGLDPGPHSWTVILDLTDDLVSKLGEDLQDRCEFKLPPNVGGTDTSAPLEHRTVDTSDLLGRQKQARLRPPDRQVCPTLG
jgi:hypothetical protein